MILYKPRLGLQAKVVISIVLILCVFGLILAYVVSNVASKALLEDNKKRGFSITVNLAARITEPLLARDYLRMKILVDEVQRLSDDVFYAFAMDDNDNILVHTFRKGGFPVQLKGANKVQSLQDCHIELLDTGDDLIYDFAVPVMIGKDRVGTVRVGLSRSVVRKAINRLLWVILLVTGIGVLLASGVETALARTIIRRIKILHDSSEQILRGNLDVSISPEIKKYCWEIMNCKNQDCPAYGNTKRRCWYIAGTMCPTCRYGEYAKKIETCKKCVVYRKTSGDEIQRLAEAFEVMVFTLNDHIHDLKQAKSILKEQQQLLKTILDVTPDLVALMDKNSVYQAANKAFCDFFLQSEEEIVGKTVYDVYSREEAEEIERENIAVLQKGEIFHKEAEKEGPEGKRWFYVVRVPAYDDKHNIMGLVCSWRDITRLKQYQEQLVQAQKMESVGQLAGGVAHEINTPLGIILGYAQLILKHTEQDTQTSNDLKMIVKQTKICRDIVKDLLRFSRREISSKEQVNINDSIDEVISLVEHPFSLDRVRIIKHFSKDSPVIFGDNEKLKQIWINLLNNARDAIGADGLVSVTTRIDKEKNEVVASFGDTGPGIAKEHFSKLFEPFFTTKGVGKGTGLGLAVTYGIVQDHAGRIEVFSPPPPDLALACGLPHKKREISGTVFMVYLPLTNK